MENGHNRDPEYSSTQQNGRTNEEGFTWILSVLLHGRVRINNRLFLRVSSFVFLRRKTEPASVAVWAGRDFARWLDIVPQHLVVRQACCG